MHIRIEYELRDLHFHADESFEFLDATDTSAKPVKATIWNPIPPEPRKFGDDKCLALVQSEVDVSPKVRLQFDGDKRTPALEEVYKGVERRFYDSLTRILGAIRWLCGTGGEFNPVASAGLLHWSDDGQEWKPIPGKRDVQITLGLISRRMSKGIEAGVNQSLGAGYLEPLGHELFQEAWSQRDAFPRSSLLIGMTAAEVGFKAFVSNLVPHAEWLAMNLPSPPLTRMLEEYLPSLPVKLGFGDGAPFVPKKVIENLKIGVMLRNKTAHAEGKISRDTLEKVLRAVRDLLYILDSYAGHQWAANNISAETQKLIKAELLKEDKPK